MLSLHGRRPSEPLAKSPRMPMMSMHAMLVRMDVPGLVKRVIRLGTMRGGSSGAHGLDAAARNGRRYRNGCQNKANGTHWETPGVRVPTV